MEMSNNQNQDELTEEQVESLYSYIKEISTLKYNSELRREDSLIKQSGRMQTAFSFMTASVFMITPVLIEYRGDLSLEFFLVAISFITAALLTSLVFASIAQRRVKKQTFMNIPDIEKFVVANYKGVLSEKAKLKQWVQVVGDVQEDLDKTNNKRVFWIRLSMGFFFGTIAMIVIWYVIGISRIM